MDVITQHCIGIGHFHGTQTDTIDLGLVGVGDVFRVEILNVINHSPRAVDNVVVTLSQIPDGLSFVQEYLPFGSWDPVQLKWTIPSLPGKASATAALDFEITDDTMRPWVFDFQVATGSVIEEWLGDNQFIVVVDGIACTHVVQCVSDAINIEIGDDLNCELIVF